MALVLLDRVKETTSTAGTGALTLTGAAAGYQTFSTIGNGNTCYYAISSTGAEWEVGIGTYTSSGNTLSRDTILSSSNGGTIVTLSAGVKDVYIVYPAEKGVWVDSSGQSNYAATIGSTSVKLGQTVSTIGGLTTLTLTQDPGSALEAATKQYVDTLVSSGVTYHTPVKYEVPSTTGNLTALYSNGASGVGATLTNNGTKAAFAPDGPTASIGDRILIYNQTNAFENGVYEVTTVGTPDPGGTNWVLTRTADADSYGLKDTNALGNGDAFYITSGNTGAGETYICNTAGTINFGTTNITFVQVSSAQIYSAGTGLTLTNTTFSITPVGTANTYGSASSVPVITTNASGQVSSVTPTSISINGNQITSGTVGAGYGGTGLATYTTGDIIYASAATTLTTLGITGTSDYVLKSTGSAPSWVAQSTLSVGSATTATTATNLSGGALGSLPYQSSSGSTSLLAGNTTTTKKYLIQTGDGVNSAAPTWDTIQVADVPTLNQNTTGTAAGLSGTQTANYFYAAPDGTSGVGVWRAIVAADIPTLNQNTTGQAGSVAFALTINNGGAGDASGTTYNGSAAKTISYNSIGASPLAGSTSLVTTGAITAGTWNATTIGTAYGGTGQTTYTDGELLIGNSTGNTLTKATITAGSGISVTNGSGSITIANTQAAGVTITNDTSTATDVYPTFATATGSTATLYVTNTKLKFVPSTGTFTVPNVEASNGMIVNSATVSTNYSIPVGSNAVAVGPITVGSGAAVTVPSGSRWVVL